MAFLKGALIEPRMSKTIVVAHLKQMQEKIRNEAERQMNILQEAIELAEAAEDGKSSLPFPEVADSVASAPVESARGKGALHPDIIAAGRKLIEPFDADALIAVTGAARPSVHVIFSKWKSMRWIRSTDQKGKFQREEKFGVRE